MAPQTRRQLRESVDIPVVAAGDARTVLEVAGSDEEIPREIASVYDAEIVIPTRGDGGTIAFEADGTFRDQSLFPAEATDPIGGSRTRTIRLKSYFERTASMVSISGSVALTGRGTIGEPAATEFVPTETSFGITGHRSRPRT